MHTVKVGNCYWTTVALWFLCTALYAQRPSNEVEITEVKADTSLQRDLIDIAKRVIKMEPPRGPDSTGKKFYFSALPFSTSVPGGGHALITSTTAGFYLGDRKDTYMSRATFTPYWNFKRRYGFPIRSYIWLNKNKWVISGDTRILKYPQHTWGLGRQYSEDEKLLVDYSYFRFYQHLLKRIGKGFFIGGGYNLDIRMGIHAEAEDTRLRDYTGYPYGTAPAERTISSGLSLNLLFDTRANSINPIDGNYVNLQFRVNPKFMGSGESWESLYIDVKRYHRLTANPNRQHMIAVWSYFWTVFNSNAPYLDLPTIGWDTYNGSGRGFEQSRYRGKYLYYIETEYRRDLTANGLFGFVVFANANTVNGPRSTFFWTWNPGGGAGLRIKFNKNSGTNIALDYGFSRSYSGFRLSLGEVF
ncbi:hypothetical protein JHJ32_11315 [Parapedobacter sp. ISTM3]|uniref:Surface antigen n=1 Tax=Parapedobacter luteus TaxID=623280 RepID=A0A1T5D0G8_9SPHI|nr:MULTISPECIES: hypothetical protein [Parapedobacter]MBK1440577.1 hypothetical protein [Parapedobacter sp. ISTM3]SKB65071.1 hypothetical protein SAMN05660226_02514 [Parapedobacter luteus]